MRRPSPSPPSGAPERRPTPSSPTPIAALDSWTDDSLDSGWGDSDSLELTLAPRIRSSLPPAPVPERAPEPAVAAASPDGGEQPAAAPKKAAAPRKPRKSQRWRGKKGKTDGEAPEAEATAAAEPSPSEPAVAEPAPAESAAAADEATKKPGARRRKRR